MALKLVTAPTELPVTLTEAKAHLRVDHGDEDALIELYLNAAVSHLDSYSGILGRCMVSQTWALSYDTFPDGAMQIPLGNLISVTSVEYADPDSGVMTTWSSVNYDVDTQDINGWIKPVDDWPTHMETMNAVKVTFVAGYGAASAVPAALKSAILLLVGHWYTNREAVMVGESVAELPLAVSALVAPFRMNPI
jgi:uncharacterized phiE125 gp8 family phage protein